MRVVTVQALANRMCGRAIAFALSAFLVSILLVSNAFAQANIHNGGVPLNTDQNSSNTASGVLEDRGSDSDANTVPYRSAQFDMGFSLTGTGSGAIWQGGIEYRETGGVDILYVQANVVNRNAGRFPTYDFVFTRGVENLTFEMGGIDNLDSNRLTFFYQGSPVATSTTWVTSTNPNGTNTITPLLLSATELEVASRNTGGASGNLLLNTATIVVPAGVLVDRVVINGGKNGSNAVNTLSFYNFDWSGIPIVATNDSQDTVNGFDGQADVLNVLDNDTLDDPDTAGTDTATIGGSSTSLTVTLTQDSTSNPNVTLDESTGEISVAAGTPPGNYTVNYTICENNTVPTNCDSAVATVTVAPHADLQIAKTNGATEVFSGSTSTYTLTVSHNGGNSITGAVVSDTPGAGLSCDAASPVTITGDGVPAGSFTIADLTGGGIVLDTLSSGQSTSLSYSCQVN